MDFNIFKSLTKREKHIAALIIGIIFPPSLLVSILTIIRTGLVRFAKFIKELDEVTFKLTLCRCTPGEDYSVTKCGAHVSSSALKCPICNNELFTRTD